METKKDLQKNITCPSINFIQKERAYSQATKCPCPYEKKRVPIKISFV